MPNREERLVTAGEPRPVRILVSACLLGERVRYNGGEATSSSPLLGKWMSEDRIVPFCPEVAGGLGVPRPAAEIRGAGGAAVLDGTAAVITEGGTEATAAFLRGARLALDAALAAGVRLAVLKEGSPSCGSGFIYDGSFTGQRRSGQGVTAALFQRQGIRVFSEGRLDEAAAYLAALEAGFSLRKATLEDAPLLEQVIAESARGLSRQDYTDAQIEAALGSAFGVDTELIRDGTYFVAEAAGQIVGCGGWSRRQTRFGSDRQPGRQSEILDPGRDSARIRAFFVRPDWARRGIGRALLERCEAEARMHGFRSLELVATLPGRRLYEAFGYAAGEPIQHHLETGLTIEFVPMRKALA